MQIILTLTCINRTCISVVICWDADPWLASTELCEVLMWFVTSAWKWNLLSALDVTSCFGTLDELVKCAIFLLKCETLLISGDVLHSFALFFVDNLCVLKWRNDQVLHFRGWVWIRKSCEETVVQNAEVSDVLWVLQQHRLEVEHIWEIGHINLLQCVAAHEVFRVIRQLHAQAGFLMSV